jgi:hypothetical protein
MRIKEQTGSVACNPNYLGGRGRRIVVQGQASKSRRSCLRKKKKEESKKDWGLASSGRAKFKPQYHQKKKRERSKVRERERKGHLITSVSCSELFSSSLVLLSVVLIRILCGLAHLSLSLT